LVAVIVAFCLEQPAVFVLKSNVYWDLGDHHRAMASYKLNTYDLDQRLLLLFPTGAV
jgi:hypothetical protein